MSRAPHIYVLAAEPSGEQLGAALIRHIRDTQNKAKDTPYIISGIGGPAMRAEGVESLFDTSPLSLLGIFDGLKHYGTIMALVRRAVDDIMDKQADAVILIDSWGFMIRVAAGLKKAGYQGQIIKYVAPQVWATREGRSKTLADYAHHLLAIHHFEPPYFERYGLPTQYVGNPVFDQDYSVGDGPSLRREYEIAPDAPLCAVLFGSRLSEVQRLATPFADTIELLLKERPDIRFISPLSANVATDVRAAAGADQRLNQVIFTDENRKLDIFAASQAALACSGTVTTQIACAGLPAVIAYKLGPLSFLIAKQLFKPKFIAMVNIAAGRAIMPEYMQKDVTGPVLAQTILPYLTQKDVRDAASKALLEQTAKIAGDGGIASAQAAQAVIEIVKKARKTASLS